MKVTKEITSGFLPPPHVIVRGYFDETYVCDCLLPTSDVPRMGEKDVATIMGQEWHLKSCSRVIGTLKDNPPHERE